jgi:hypothetical protein
VFNLSRMLEREHTVFVGNAAFVVGIEVTEMEIETLAELGHMESDLRRDVAAIQNAANLYFGDRLFEAAS